jgi:hypothetical protein
MMAPSDTVEPKTESLDQVSEVCKGNIL